MAEEPTAGMAAARAIAVPLRFTEEVRVALRDAGLLDLHLAPRTAADEVLLPLRGDAGDVAWVLDRWPVARLARGEFLVRAAPAGDYRALVRGLPAHLLESLPRAHDVVGDIAVLRLPEPLLPHRAAIADAVLAARPGLRTVAIDRGVKGELRVRDLEVVAGEPRLSTVHREHGMEIEVDLERTYFSPRLATERDRLLARIRHGARVLDLFAGVGAFVVRVARERAPRAVCAVDLNAEATRLLMRNLRRNNVPAGMVDVRTGDAREVAPRTGDWDHLVMNLPHDAHRFLDVGLECVHPEGEVHLYAILERDEEPAYVTEVLARMESLSGAPWRLAERRHVRQYAPTMDGLGFTFVARA